MNYLTAFPPSLNDTVDYHQGVGHSATGMFYSTPGLYRLFLDNWDGDKSKHADFGPRQVKGDNPHPYNTISYYDWLWSNLWRFIYFPLIQVLNL